MPKNKIHKEHTVVANEMFAGVVNGSTKVQRRMRVSWCWIGGTLLLLGGLSALTVGMLMHQSKQATSNAAAEDIAHLVSIFRDINNSCGIVGFAHDVNYVDFLTVKSFVGSELGAMHVRNPLRWKGPYVADNPTVQAQIYQIIKTKNGHVLVPGTGVKLSNGLVMGKDIIIDAQTDIVQLVESGKLKARDGRALAAIISLQPQLGGAGIQAAAQ